MSDETTTPEHEFPAHYVDGVYRPELSGKNDPDHPDYVAPAPVAPVAEAAPEAEPYS